MSSLLVSNLVCTNFLMVGKAFIALHNFLVFAILLTCMGYLIYSENRLVSTEVCGGGWVAGMLSAA